MSNALDLKRLRDKREEILKAELVAWLHDVGKCSDAFLQPEGIGFKARSCRRRLNAKPYKATFSPQELTQLPYWNKLSPDIGQCPRIEEANHPTALWSTLNQINAQIPSLNVLLNGCGEGSFRELILWGRPLVSDRFSQFQGILGVKLTYLAGILGKSHGIAHIEKEDIADGGQSLEISSPFGWNIKNFKNLNVKLKITTKESDRFLRERSEIIRIFSKNMKECPGDTRHPINEVTLWDWSSIVAALYKAEIARCVLTGEQREPKNVQWRLLSIRTNGLEYLLSAPSIPDLKARQELLRNAWNKVQHLLEEEYPLALEVYRDENGPVFVVPDIDVLRLKDDQGTLEEHILRAFAKGAIEQESNSGVDVSLGLETTPHLYLDLEPWKGQPPPKELPPIGKNWKDPSKKGHLEQKVLLQSNPGWIAQFWEPVRVSYKGEEYAFTEEICQVCGLRPQGWGAPDREQHYEVQARRKAGDESARCPNDCQTCKAISRNRCYVCEKRRSNRAEKWARGAHISPEERKSKNADAPDTIWLDEVANRHGRIALLVGTFDLTHWMDGTLVRSLAVRNPEKVSDKTKTKDIAKNPSFARLRRIWETTSKFWEETLEEAEQHLGKRPRIFLKGQAIPINPKDKKDKDILGPYHAYELEILGRKVAVLWVPEKDDEVDIPQKYRGGFWVIENLDYLDNVYGKSFEKLVRGLASQSLNVYEPTEYGRPGQEQATFTIVQGTGVQSLKENYIPLIPILAEPRTFMAIVPADKALDVVKAIKAKYEREMGKVRNRLPLHLGIVFADSRQPLRTILDAGRKMLRQSAQPVAWKITCLARKQATEGDSLPSRFKSNENEQFKEWYEVSLNAAEKKITWYVPAFMGDGATEDHWYPYVFLETSSEPADRKRYYKTDLSNPWNPKHPWLVHAGELKPEDRIYFTPATFDFIFLDHSGKRFEIVYDEKGQRLGTSNRPYLLDQLEDLEACWNLLTHGRRHAQDQEKPAWRLSSRQIHQIRDAIERKREEWFTCFEDSLKDDTFKRFCKDLLASAEWRVKPNDAELDRLTEWAVNGVLTDAIELFLHIMKQRERASEQTKEGEAEK